VTQFETRRQQVEERLQARDIRRSANAHRGARAWLGSFTRLVATLVPTPAGSRSFLNTGPLVRLPRSERRALKRVTSRFDVPAGKRLLRRGEFGDSFFLIETGEVSVIGRSGPIASLGAGDFFGEIALMTQRPRTASIVATTDVRLRVIPELDFTHAMRRLPTFARIVGDAANLRLSPATS
jgi:CRP-like cAMP-binding protein